MKSIIFRFIFIFPFFISGCAKQYTLKDDRINTAVITFDNAYERSPIGNERSSVTICQKENWGVPKPYRGPEVDERQRKIYRYRSVLVSADEPVFIEYNVVTSMLHKRSCRASLYLDLTPGRRYHIAMLTHTDKSSLPSWLQTALLTTPRVKSCYIGIDKKNLIPSEVFYTPAVKLVKKSAVNCRSVTAGVPEVLQMTALDVDDWVENTMDRYRGAYRVGSYAIVPKVDGIGYSQFKEDYKMCFESLSKYNKPIKENGMQFDLLKCMLAKKDDTSNKQKWKMVR